MGSRKQPARHFSGWILVPQSKEFIDLGRTCSGKERTLYLRREVGTMSRKIEEKRISEAVGVLPMKLRQSDSTEKHGPDSQSQEHQKVIFLTLCHWPYPQGTETFDIHHLKRPLQEGFTSLLIVWNRAQGLTYCNQLTRKNFTFIEKVESSSFIWSN